MSPLVLTFFAASLLGPLGSPDLPVMCGVATITASERSGGAYVLTIRFDDMKYVAEMPATTAGESLAAGVNAEIGACVDGSRLILRRPDGKNDQLKLIRAERILR